MKNNESSQYTSTYSPRAKLVLDRRGFLRTAIKATTAVAIAPMVVRGAVLGRDGGVSPSERIILGGIGAGFLLYVMAKITGDLSKAGLMTAFSAAGLPPAVGAVTGLIALLYQEDG